MEGGQRGGKRFKPTNTPLEQSEYFLEDTLLPQQIFHNTVYVQWHPVITNPAITKTAS